MYSILLYCGCTYYRYWHRESLCFKHSTRITHKFAQDIFTWNLKYFYCFWLATNAKENVSAFFSLLYINKSQIYLLLLVFCCFYFCCCCCCLAFLFLHDRGSGYHCCISLFSKVRYKLYVGSSFVCCLSESCYGENLWLLPWLKSI